MLSPFATANRDADARAFAALMKHLKAIDGDAHTVLMVQVENEIGMIPDARDRSVDADRVFASAVPGELTDHLSSIRHARARTAKHVARGRREADRHVDRGLRRARGR